jgi:F-type H+-transporting ATPase subunit epsilon
VSTAAQAERKRLGVRILTPEGERYGGVAAMVIAPSVLGEVGILPRHAPLIAFLRPGETRLKMLDDSQLIYATTNGYLSVEEDQVLILVEQAEDATGIDRGRAEASLAQAEEDLAQVAPDDEVGRQAAEAAIERARNRLAVLDRMNSRST